jgi:hypothetical protein
MSDVMDTSRAGAKWALPFASFALCAAMLTPARTAMAQPASSQPQADALFAEGRELLEKGKFPEACSKLARSEELSPAVGTLLNLAYCYEQVGKLRSAMDAYAEAETLAVAAGEAKRATFARERFTAVESRVAKLVVRVVPPEAPGLEIKRNGTTLAKTDFDHPIPVDPQDYVVTATAPGHRPWKGAIIVRGEGAVVTLIVPPLERAATTATVAPQASPFTTRRLAAVGLGAVGALAIGAGVGVGLSAKSRYDDGSSHCDATGCDETGVGIQHGAAVQGNVATALIGFGLLSAAAGVYLWVVGAPEEKPPARAVQVGVSPFGAAVGGRF